MRKRIKFTLSQETPLGVAKVNKFKQDGTDRLEYKYMGMQVSHVHESFAKQQFIHRDTVIQNVTGDIIRYVGETQDILDDDLNTEVRYVSSISGRDKQVNNKKAQGEARRRSHEAKALSFGVSKSKSYHKLKHS